MKSVWNVENFMDEIVQIRVAAVQVNCIYECE